MNDHSKPLPAVQDLPVARGLLLDDERRSLSGSGAVEDWLIGAGRLLRSPVTSLACRNSLKAVAAGLLSDSEAVLRLGDHVHALLGVVRDAIEDARASDGESPDCWSAAAARDDLESADAALALLTSHLPSATPEAREAVLSVHANLTREVEETDEAIDLVIDALLDFIPQPDERLIERLEAVAPDAGSLADSILEHHLVPLPSTAPRELSEPILVFGRERAQQAAKDWTHRIERMRQPLLPVAAATTSVQESRRDGVGAITALGVTPSGQGLALALCVRFAGEGESGNPFRLAPGLERVAVANVKIAFAAASALMPRSLPPRDFAGHVFEFDLGDVQLDGGSLALPTALALLSLWTNTPLPRRLAATGTLDHSGKVGTVGGLKAKLDAAAAVLSERVVVPAGDVPPTSVATLPIRTLEAAREELGLRAPDDYAPQHRDVAAEVKRLQQLTEDARSQNLAAHVGSGVNAWAEMAEEMALLVRSLERNAQLAPRSRRALDAGRAEAVLAALHAMNVRLAEALMEGVSDDQLPAQARALLQVARLSAAIDRDAPATEKKRLAARLESTLDGMKDDDRRHVEGRALGTLGRVELHAGRAGEAVRLLERAVALHREDEPSEVPRSLTYLAMSLREAGRPQEALSVLAEAMSLSQRALQRHDETYAGSTEVFIRYEMARALLTSGRSADAVTAATEALTEAEKRGMSWPRPGLMRTLALAFRAAGRSDDAAMALAELEREVDAMPIDVMKRLLSEARGEPGVHEIY